MVTPLDPALALDFLNTSRPPGGGPDLWTAPADVAGWLGDAGLLPGAAPLAELAPPEARVLRDAAFRLRRALRELVEAWTTPGAPPPGMALHELNRILDQRPRGGLALTLGPAGYTLADHPGAVAPSGALARVAEAGALLLAGEDPHRVRRCAAAECGRWFLDTSRNQRRRWCSMAVCGNRAKVAAHHRRRRRAGG